MKGAIAIAAASAALAGAAATPAKLEARASGTSSGSVPTVTVKGNGTIEALAQELGWTKWLTTHHSLLRWRQALLHPRC